MDQSLRRRFSGESIATVNRDCDGLTFSRSAGARPEHSSGATRSVAQGQPRKRRADERPRVGCSEGVRPNGLKISQQSDWRDVMGGHPVGVSVGAISRFFPKEQIEEILRESGRTGVRRRKLPAADLMYFLIALGLHASEGCGSVLRRVLLRKDSIEGAELDRLSSDSAISQARARLGWEPLRSLYRAVVRPIATRASIGAWYRRWRLVTLDGSCLDVADTRRNERALGRPGASRGKAGFPQMRFVTLIENGTHVAFGAEFGPYRTGEVTLAREVVRRLPTDALCLADRNFFSYSLWKSALTTGAALLWRVKADLVLPKIKQLSDGSYLSRIYPSPRARANDTDGIPVRVIEYRLGKKDPDVYRLICSILDPRKAPAIQLANLYPRRWTIETVLGELKTRLRGPRVVLRSRIPALTRQDFYGLMLAHFGVRALMHEAALKERCEATDLSFVHSVRTIARYLPLYVAFPPLARRSCFSHSCMNLPRSACGIVPTDTPHEPSSAR